MKNNEPDQSQSDNTLAILSLAVGVSAAAAGSSGVLDLWDAVIGFILLTILISYWKHPWSGNWQVLAYCSLMGFAILLAGGGVYTSFAYPEAVQGKADPAVRYMTLYCLPYLWVILSLLVLGLYKFKHLLPWPRKR